MFKKALPIWLDNTAAPDEYAEFCGTFTLDGDACFARVTVGGDYNLYVNGALASFGQYADYPEHRFYNEVDLGDYVKKGENTFSLVVWYYGVDSQTYIKSDAYAAFEFFGDDGEVIAYSDKNTLSRPAVGYVPHLCRNITSQLGLAWRYDATDVGGGFGKSRELSLGCEFKKRPIKNLVIEDITAGSLIKRGGFKSADLTVRGADIMQNAEFIDGEGDGEYYIFDLGRESVGFPEFSFETDGECEVLIGWGEHLDDGRCRTAVRNFSCEYRAKRGENRFLGSLRRFGCRYIQLFFVGGRARNVNVGLRVTRYPLNYNPVRFDGLRREIYETARHTLECCMHEHYEDCPWREQALYTLDSRNQMLCGYYAFGEHEFPRAAMKLMSYGVRPDGLLPLCFPAGKDFPIPSFSLVYYIQMAEYIEHSGDTSLAEECFSVLTSVLDVFIGKIGANGLVGGFPGYWNFYEWSKGMSGKFNDEGLAIEAPLNAFFVLGLESMVKICKALGRDFEIYEKTAEEVRRAISAYFLNPDTKLFESFSDRERGRYSVLTNSLCLLAGAAEGIDKSNILKILGANGAADTGYDVVPNTLSMNGFRFDALLREDREKYAPMILSELDTTYKYMLDRGATTFWETIKGADDFGGAGSLCHGWSALPIYYYEILG